TAATSSPRAPMGFPTPRTACASTAIAGRWAGAAITAATTVGPESASAGTICAPCWPKATQNCGLPGNGFDALQRCLQRAQNFHPSRQNFITSSHRCSYDDYTQLLNNCWSVFVARAAIQSGFGKDSLQIGCKSLAPQCNESVEMSMVI